MSVRRTSLHFAMLTQMAMGIQATEDSIVLDQRNYVIGMLERNCIGVSRIFEGTTWFMLICISGFASFFVFDMTNNKLGTIVVAVSPGLLLLVTTKFCNKKSLIDHAREFWLKGRTEKDSSGADGVSLSLSSSSQKTFGMDGGSFRGDDGASPDGYVANPLRSTRKFSESVSSASFLSTTSGERVIRGDRNHSSGASVRRSSATSHLAEGFNRDSYLEMTTTGAAAGTYSSSAGAGSSANGSSANGFYATASGAGGKDVKRSKVAAIPRMTGPVVSPTRASPIPESLPRDANPTFGYEYKPDDML